AFAARTTFSCAPPTSLVRDCRECAPSQRIVGARRAHSGSRILLRKCLTAGDRRGGLPSPGRSAVLQNRPPTRRDPPLEEDETTPAPSAVWSSRRKAVRVPSAGSS